VPRGLFNKMTNVVLVVHCLLILSLGLVSLGRRLTTALVCGRLAAAPLRSRWTGCGGVGRILPAFAYLPLGNPDYFSFTLSAHGFT
jgi:hypothetical protein